MENDYELIELAKEKDEFAIKKLHEKYYPLIKGKALKISKYTNKKGIELEDIIQEALIGFEEAIVNYNPEDKTLFYTFANLCIDRQLNTLLLKINRNKHKILNEAVSIDILNEEGESINLLNSVIDEEENPEVKLLSSIQKEELIKKIEEQLTNFESLVFNLMKQEYNYKEIADILDKDNKQIDNAIQRIKMKLKKLMENE